MKKRLAALALGLTMMTGWVEAKELPVLQIEGEVVDAVSHVESGTTYIGLRSVARAMDEEAVVTWESGAAMVRTEDLELRAVPGEKWICANGRYLYVPGGVQLIEGRTLLPIRVLADAFGAMVDWNGETRKITVRGSENTPVAQYEEDALYWLARIISAESRGESLRGQIAVGNVVLNRVKSSDFPDTVYDVVFDSRWGGQFEPVRNGTIYSEPAVISVIAAKLCLEGADVAGKSLYFLDPTKAKNLWAVKNRPYLMSIGVHDFYG